MVMTIDLKGKLVLLTGGGRGLGKDIAKSLAEAGADLALTYNASPADAFAQELQQEYGVSCKAYKMPAEDSKAITATVDQITKEFREIDIVIANAGICIHQDAINMTDEEFESVIRVNLISPFYLSRAVFKTWFSSTTPSEKKDKNILFVSSISGIITNTPQNQCAYNASKAGLTMLSKSLAGEWAKTGVRVNSISPGYIKTDMSTGSASAAKMAGEWQARTPIDRFAEPKEVADMITVLVSSKSSFMTGSDVVVDGGYTLF